MKIPKITLREVAKLEEGVYCHLLDYGGLKVLINCGLPNDLSHIQYEGFDFTTVSLIILNHSSLEFSGGIPYAVSKGFSGKIYSTTPVAMFSRFIISEMVKSYHEFRGLDVVSEDILDKVFSMFMPVKYLQPIEIESGISIVAYGSGSDLGGAIWNITNGNDNVVVGLRFDHRKMNHVNGIDIGSIPQSSLCIFDTSSANQATVNRKDRNKFMADLVESVIRENRRILILVRYDQFLEVSLLLDRIIGSFKPNNVFATCVGFESKKFSDALKSVAEWAGDNVAKEFSDNKENPFSFNHINFECNFSHVNMESRIFIAFEEFGFTDKLIECINDDPFNVIVNFIGLRVKEGMHIDSLPCFTERCATECIEEMTEARECESTVKHVRRWYEVSYDYWADSNERECLPYFRKSKPFDEYNEFFSHDVFLKNDEEVVVPKGNVRVAEDAHEVSDEIQMLPANISLKCKVVECNLESVSDMNSAITILETLNFKKLVLLSTGVPLSKFYYYRVGLNKNFNEVILFDKECVLTTLDGFNVVVLGSSFKTLNHRSIRGCDYVGFKGKVEYNRLEYLGPLDKIITIGDIRLNVLRKCFLENNIRAEIIDNTLVVEGKVKITSGDGVCSLYGAHSALYYVIRDVLYMNIVYV